jgi:hypothetical protein
MKTKNLIIYFLFLISSVTFGQTYSYNLKTVKALVQTSNGNDYRTLNAYQGPYSFVFETPNDPQIKRLFTLLYPGQNIAPGQPWYGLLQDSGYIEKNGVIYKKSIYYYTKTNEKVMVMIANDYSQIIIFNSDDTIWEFTN